MKEKYLVLIPKASLLNPKFVSSFDEMKKDDVVYLNSSLYLNNLDNAEKLRNTELISVFDLNDKDYANENFPGKYFASVEETEFIPKLFTEKLSPGSLYLFMFPNSIGISSQRIFKIFSLLSSDENSIIIGKTLKQKVGYIGLNVLSEEIIKCWLTYYQNFDDFIGHINAYDFQTNVLKGSMLIEDSSDFTNLYDELSKKKSEDYCSVKMHEHFTHLFIEYKDLLK